MSVTISGLIGMILSLGLKGAGVEIVSEDISTFIYVAAQVLSAIVIYFGRFRQGDINILGGKSASN